jgi:hypothetical protein
MNAALMLAGWLILSGVLGCFIGSYFRRMGRP